MKKQNKYFIYVILLILLKATECLSTTYYISPNGDDSNNGTSISTPWKTLKKVSRYSYNIGFSPGSVIKFEAGKIFESDTSFFGEELLLVNSGNANSPIILTSYDTSNSGKRATIKARSDKAGLLCAGSEYVSITNINFTSTFNPFNQNNATVNNNIGIWILTTYGNTGSFIRKKNIYIDSCGISRFINSGISVQYSDSDRTRFSGYDSVKITHCRIDSIGKLGIFINWFRNTLYPFSEFGHRNFIIRDCEISRVTGLSTDSTNNGSGILILDADTALIEHNLVYSCGGFGTISTGPSAIESAQCRNLIYQYNEVYNQQTNSGHDGHGLHFGDGVQNSLMQFNYAHDNDGPGLSCFTYNSGYPLRDSNNILRYNISSKNLRNADYQTGNINIGAGNGKTIFNISVYSNTVYATKNSESSGDVSGILIARHAENIFFRNNIIVSTDTNVFLWYHYPLENSINIILQGNCYWSTNQYFKFQEGNIIYLTYESWQTESGKELIKNLNVGFTEDPKLKNPINAGSINNTYKLDTLTAFQTQVNSVIRENGLNLDSVFSINPGTKDFYGNTLPKGNKYDIGAYEDPTNYTLIDLTVLIEGFYNQSSDLQVGDTMTLNLISSISPYSEIVSNKAFINSNGKATFYFNFNEIEQSGCYDLYQVISHRNSIQTWSYDYRTFSNWERISYDFTTDSTKAFGFNLVRKGSKFCIYSGDVNQDGVIDGSDLSLIEVDANNFATGYLQTDLNGDQVIEGADFSIAENNAASQVSVVSP